LNLKEKDYQLILDTYSSIEWKEDYIIYLTAKPDTILKRIIQRGSLEKIRREWNETENNYLLTILSYYNQFLSSDGIKEKVFTIDTDLLNTEDVAEKIEEIIKSLSGHSFKKSFKLPTSQVSLIKFLKE
jgi:deoxyadenosine/deoxycytidine kinase